MRRAADRLHRRRVKSATSEAGQCRIENVLASRALGIGLEFWHLEDTCSGNKYKNECAFCLSRNCGDVKANNCSFWEGVSVPCVTPAGSKKCGITEMEAPEAGEGVPMQPVDSKRGAVGPAAHRSSLNPRGCMSRAKFQSSRDQVLRQPLIVAGPRCRAIIGTRAIESSAVTPFTFPRLTRCRHSRPVAKAASIGFSIGCRIIWWLALEVQAIRREDTERTSITSGTACR